MNCVLFTFFFLLLSSVTCSSSLTPASNESAYIYDPPDPSVLVYSDFKTNVEVAEFLYLTWLSDTTRFEVFLASIEDVGYWNKMSVMYTLAAIDHVEFQQENKYLLAPYAGSMLAFFTPVTIALKCINRPPHFRLSQFKPRKEFNDGRALYWAARFTLVDPPSIKMWWRPGQGSLYALARSISDHVPRVHLDSYFKKIEKTSGFSWRCLCGDNFLKDYVKLVDDLISGCSNDAVAESTDEGRLNLLLTYWSDFDVCPRYSRSYTIPNKLQATPIINGAAFLKLIDNKLGHCKKLSNFIVELAQRKHILYDAINSQTVFSDEFFDLLSSHLDRDHYLSVFLKSIRSGNAFLVRKLSINLNTSRLDSELLHWHTFVYCSEIVFETMRTDGIEGVIEFLQNGGFAEYMNGYFTNSQILARLMLVPGKILKRFSKLFSDPFVSWVLSDMSPKGAAYRARYYKESLFEHWNVKAELVRAIRAVFYDQCQLSKNEENIKRYLSRIEMLKYLGLSKIMFNHANLIDSKREMSVFLAARLNLDRLSIDPEVRVINGYGILVDVSKALKFSMIPRGLFLCGKKHGSDLRLVLKFAPGDSKEAEIACFDSLPKALLVMKPLISHELVKMDEFDVTVLATVFPREAPLILEFMLFINLASRLQDERPVLDTLSEVASMSEADLGMDQLASSLLEPYFKLEWQGESAEIMCVEDTVLVISCRQRASVLKKPLFLDVANGAISLKSSDPLCSGISIDNITMQTPTLSEFFKLVGFFLSQEIIDKFPSREFFKHHANLANPESDRITMNHFLRSYKTLHSDFKHKEKRASLSGRLILFAAMDESILLSSEYGFDANRLIEFIEEQIALSQFSLFGSINAICYLFRLITDFEKRQFSLPAIRERLSRILSMMKQDYERLTAEELRLLVLLLPDYFHLVPKFSSLSNKLVQKSCSTTFPSDLTKECRKQQSKIAKKVNRRLRVLKINSEVYFAFFEHPALFKLLLGTDFSLLDKRRLIDYAYMLDQRRDLLKVALQVHPDISPSYQTLREICPMTLQFAVQNYTTPEILRVLLLDRPAIQLNGYPLCEIHTRLVAFRFPHGATILSSNAFMSVIVDWIKGVGVFPGNWCFFRDLVDHCFSGTKFMNLWSQLHKIAPQIAPSLNVIDGLVAGCQDLCLNEIGTRYTTAPIPSWEVVEGLLIQGSANLKTFQALDKFTGFAAFIAAHYNELRNLYTDYCNHHRGDPKMLHVLHWLGQAHAIYPPASLVQTISADRRYDLMMLMMSLGVNWTQHPFSAMRWNSTVDRRDYIGSSMYLLMNDSVYGINIKFEGEPAGDYGGPSAEWATLTIRELLADEGTFPRLTPEGSAGAFVFPYLDHKNPLSVAKLRLLAFVHALCLRRGVAIEGEMAPVLYEKALQGVMATFSLDDLKAVDGQEAGSIGYLRDFDEDMLAEQEFYLQSGSKVTIDDLDRFIQLKVEKFFEGFFIYACELARVTERMVMPYSGARFLARLHGTAIVTADMIIAACRHSIDAQRWSQFGDALRLLEASEDLPMLLVFWTGSRRLGPSSSLKIEDGYNVPELNGVPHSVTCFNILKLGARYESIEALARALRIASENPTTFAFV